MDNLVILTGPTGIGKTELSLNLCRGFQGEIISSDSMQIYRQLDIGTAKIDLDTTDIRHHMVDIIDPWENFSVARFKAEAEQLIRDINGKNKIPFVVGGTGLYINSLVYDLNFNTEPNWDLRNQLERELEVNGLPKLYDKLRALNPVEAVEIDGNNPNRIIRALEVELSGNKRSTRNFRKEINPYHLAYIGLHMDRQRLYDRINNRVDSMVERGLIDEVSTLMTQGLNREHQSMKAIGYKEVIDHLEGYLTFEEMVDAIKQNSRRYAKRQLTWFRRDKRIKWFDAEDPKLFNEVTKYIEGRIKNI